MDWKPYYRGEIESMSGRETVETLLRGAVPGAIDELLIGEAIVSFPHTALRYAGPLQARVVRMIYRLGIERVIALGVLHGSSVAVYKKASGTPRRRRNRGVRHAMRSLEGSSCRANRL